GLGCRGASGHVRHCAAYGPLTMPNETAWRGRCQPAGPCPPAGGRLPALRRPASRLSTDICPASRDETDVIMTQIRAPWGRSGGGEAAVHADELAGDVGAGGAGQKDGDALEVGGLAVAADHGTGGQRGRPDRVGGDLAGER